MATLKTKEFNFPRCISDLIPLAGIIVLYFNIIDLSFISFLSVGAFELFIDYRLYALIGLSVLLLVDFLVYGPPQEITAIIVAIGAAFCLQNYILGALFGLLSMILLSTIGQIGASKNKY